MFLDAIYLTPCLMSPLANKYPSASINRLPNSPSRWTNRNRPVADLYASTGSIRTLLDKLPLREVRFVGKLSIESLVLATNFLFEDEFTGRIVRPFGMRISSKTPGSGPPLSPVSSSRTSCKLACKHGYRLAWQRRVGGFFQLL